MHRKNGTTVAESSGASGQGDFRSDDRVEYRWQRLLETVKLLDSSVGAAESEHQAPRLQAVVIDIGPPSPQALRKLRAFRAHFPHIDIVTPNSGSAAAGRGNLDLVISGFAASRGLSPRQRRILELHLSGKHDKEIASELGCEQSTIYEHWRRMAQKAGGSRKSDLIADFHRHLASSSEPTAKD